MNVTFVNRTDRSISVNLLQLLRYFRYQNSATLLVFFFLQLQIFRFRSMSDSVALEPRMFTLLARIF